VSESVLKVKRLFSCLSRPHCCWNSKFVSFKFMDIYQSLL